MLIRHEQWPGMLDSFLQANQGRKFAYGSWDCCLFVADAIEIMTGVDVAAPFRGLYRSRREAMAEVVEKYCGRRSVASMAAAVFREAGLIEAPSPMFARRGDVVLLKRSRDFSLGIVALNGREIVITSNRGLWRVPLARAVRAWQV